MWCQKTVPELNRLILQGIKANTDIIKTHVDGKLLYTLNTTVSLTFFGYTPLLYANISKMCKTGKGLMRQTGKKMNNFNNSSTA